MLSLTFLSSAVSPMNEEQLVELVKSVRPKNEARGVTGVMLYADGHFIETIEGPEEAVEATFAKFALDPRHHNIHVALRERIDERAFPDWSMGFRALSAEQAASLPGFNDYMNAQRTLHESGRKLSHPEVFHRAFRDGSRYAEP